MPHPYSTHQDILDRMAVEELIRLTTTGVGSLSGKTEAEKEALVDWDIVDASIERSDSTIDAFAPDHVVTPLVTPSGLAKLLSADLTVCDIWARRPHATKNRATTGQTTVDAATEKCRNAQEMLEKILDGQLNLVPPVAVKSDNAVTFSGAARVFSRNKMTGW